MLIEMLKKNKQFQDTPIDKQEILARLATLFEEDFKNLYLGSEELAEETQVGNKHQWQELLSLDIVQAFIKQQMGQHIQVANRKAILALQSEALRGNVPAAKQINELSGLLNQQDQNKTVVLHRIERPKTIH